MSEDRELRLMRKLDQLSEEHKMLQQTLTEEIQPKMRGLMEQSRRADQIVQAVKKGSVKSPHYIPDVEEGYWPTVRKMVVQAVYSLWEEYRRPTKDRREVVPIVQERIEDMRKLGKWPRSWGAPGRDTIVRRENEAADLRHYPEGITPLICISAGRYLPNPLMFSEPTRSELQRLAESYH